MRGFSVPRIGIKHVFGQELRPRFLANTLRQCLVRHPSWPLRQSLEQHASCFRSSIALPEIASQARQDAIRPRRDSTATLRNDVIDRESLHSWSSPAVLTRAHISTEQVASSEWNMRESGPVGMTQDDHLGETEFVRHHPDARVGVRNVESHPILEVVRLEGLGSDDSRSIAADKDERTSHRDDVDRRPVAIQDESWFVENGTHLRSIPRRYGPWRILSDDLVEEGQSSARSNSGERSRPTQLAVAFVDAKNRERSFTRVPRSDSRYASSTVETRNAPVGSGAPRSLAPQRIDS